MSERMELNVDFRNDIAAQNIRDMVELLDLMKRKADEADASFRRLETSGRQASAAAEPMGKAIGDIATNAQTANPVVGQLADNLEKIAGTSSQLKEAAGNMEDLAENTDSMASTLNKLGGDGGAGGLGKLGSTLGTIATVTAAFKVAQAAFQGMEAGAARSVSIQNELTDLKVEWDQRAQIAAANLQKFGPEGIADTKQMAYDLSKRTAVSPDTSLALIGSAAQVGYDPESPEGAAIIEQLARAAILRGPSSFGPQEAEMMLKYLQARNIKTGAQAESELASVMDLFKQSGSGDLSSFLAGMLRAVQGQVDEGANSDAAKARYAAVTIMSKNARRADSIIDMLGRTARGNDDKSLGFLANLAATDGLTKAGAVSDQDVESAIAAGGTPEARAILSRRRELARHQQSHTDEIDQLNRRLSQAKLSARIAASPVRRRELQDEIDQIQKQLAEKSQNGADDLTNEQADLNRMVTEFRQKMVVAQQVSAYQGLNLEQQIAVLTRGYDDAAKAGPSALANFRRHVVTADDQVNLDMYMAAATQEKIAQLMKSGGDVTQFRQNFQQSLRSAPSQRQLADLQAQLTKEGGEDIGTEYARNVQIRSDARLKKYEEGMGPGEAAGWGAWSWILRRFGSEGPDPVQDTREYANVLREDIDTYAAGLPAGTPGAEGLRSLHYQIDNLVDSAHKTWFDPNTVKRKLYDVAANAAKLKRDIEANRQQQQPSKPTESSGPNLFLPEPAREHAGPPSTQPTTQPTARTGGSLRWGAEMFRGVVDAATRHETDDTGTEFGRAEDAIQKRSQTSSSPSPTTQPTGPVSQAGDVHHHYYNNSVNYNISNGNVWMSPGGELDLPGPLG